MSETAERFRKVSERFTRCVGSVPPDAWDNPAPCDGWVARDVVRHLVEWMPSLFLVRAGLEAPDVPSVDDDPAAAWAVVRDAIQAAVDDPEVASRSFETPVGTSTVESGVARFGIADVLVHTWDLARAAGLDETLDPEEVKRLLGAMEQVDEKLMRGSGQFGPRVEVPDDADDQTKLIAFTGRRP